MRCSLFKMLLPYAVEYHQSNYNFDKFIPDVIKNRINEYIQEQDAVFEYVKENCEKTDNTEFIKIRDMYDKIKFSGRLKDYGNNGKDLMLKNLM